MALNFPSSPTNGDTFEEYIYNSTTDTWDYNETTSDSLTLSTLRLTSTSDVTTSSTTHAFQIGADGGINLRIDGNEVQVVNNGSAGVLSLNREGGNVEIGTNFVANLTVNGNVTATSFIGNGSSLVDVPDKKNYLINGGFDFWQRGTTFTVDGYCADRWYFDETGTCNVTQETTSLPAGFNYALKAQATTANDSADIFQCLESSVVIPLRGKTVTFSCYLKMDSNMQALGNFELIADYSNASDARTSQTTVIGTEVVDKSLYTDWARASYTFVVPSDAVGLKVGVEPPFTSSSPSTSVYWITGAMLEVGSSATTFRRAGSTWTEEQMACYRYYQRHGVILGRTDNTNVWKIIHNPLGELLRTTATSVSVSTISLPASGGTLGSNLSLTISGEVYYTSAGSSSNGAWLNFDDVKVECEL